ncbi:hypothetical protein Tco_1523439 [Tanacetum coccineum]
MQRKGRVTEEQVSSSLYRLSKKKRTTDQFILVRRDQTSHDSTTGPSSQPKDDTSEKVIHESSSTSDSERTESETETAAPKGDKDQGEVDSSTVTSGVSIPISDPEKAHEALAGPDPEPMKEDQTGSDSGKLHVSLAGPNPENMDDEFLATVYPKVHENLKLITDERVINDKPESHSGSILSHLLSSYWFTPHTNQHRSYNNHHISPRDQSRYHRPFTKRSGKIGFLRLLDKYLRTKLDDAHLKILKRVRRRLSNQKGQDDEDDDDDEGPSAGSNQGRSTKRRRSDSAASGSAQPPPKDDDQSSKKPRESDASATKQHPALTSTGWQILHKICMGMTQIWDIPDNAHIPKVSTTTWFKPIPESERPATPEPEWTIPPNDFPEPENNWANTYATAYKVPEENKLQRKTYDIGSFIKWFSDEQERRSSAKLN